MSIALFAALVLQAAPAAADPPVPREAHVFADWVVACDNGGRCEAVGVQPENAHTGNNVMTAERDAAPDAPLVLRLT